ncbi:hypothetical protein VTO73DRAFT_9737 [Trametes versicolor]
MPALKPVWYETPEDPFHFHEVPNLRHVPISPGSRRCGPAKSQPAKFSGQRHSDEGPSHQRKRGYRTAQGAGNALAGTRAICILHGPDSSCHRSPPRLEAWTVVVGHYHTRVWRQALASPPSLAPRTPRHQTASRPCWKAAAPSPRAAQLFWRNLTGPRLAQ